jgi:hypothetical protein
VADVEISAIQQARNRSPVQLDHAADGRAKVPVNWENLSRREVGK